MSGVEQITVAADEGDIRLDRWFHRRYPSLSHGRLEKLLRTGQVRVDGGRAKSGQRLQAGQIIRVPPLGDSGSKPVARAVREADAAAVQAMVLYRNDALIALNKPPGLAVQGGTKTERHLDGMLDALRFGAAERPRLVHRLDRDTSGVLVVARTAPAATWLARAFQGRAMEKVYWALVAGHPRHPAGTISAALVKAGGPGQERMVWDEEEGKKAVTDYRVVATAGGRITWLELMPRTGRTHQLRAHCALIGTPVLGDGKYLSKDHVPLDLAGGLLSEIAGKLCLHARALTMEQPNGKPLTVTAPLPAHMTEAFKQLGFDPAEAEQ